MINRVKQRIFGENAPASQGGIGVFGSKGSGSGTAQYSKNISIVQSLNQWLTGLNENSLSSKNAPYQEDLNGLFYVITSQLAYLMQSGIAEWESDTEYYAGKSVVLKDGKVYIALLDNIDVNPEESTTVWRDFSSIDTTVSTTSKNAVANSAITSYVDDKVAQSTSGTTYYVNDKIAELKEKTNLNLTGLTPYAIANIGDYSSESSGTVHGQFTVPYAVWYGFAKNVGERRSLELQVSVDGSSWVTIAEMNVSEASLFRYSDLGMVNITFIAPGMRIRLNKSGSGIIFKLAPLYQNADY